MCFDTDAPEFFSQQKVTVRKERRCCECFLPIRRGEKATVCAGKWDSGFESFTTCEFCMWMRERISAKEIEHGCAPHESQPCFQGLMDALMDFAGEEIGLVPLEMAQEELALRA